MMQVLSVAGKLSRDKLQKSQRVGSAANYFLKRKDIITNLLVEVCQDSNDMDKNLLLKDLKTWDHKSRPKLREFNGIRVIMRLLLKPKYEKYFPYLKDIAKPVSEQKFLAKITRRDYLIVMLSLISYKEFETLMSPDTPLPVTSESGITNVLTKELAKAI
jgi:hypothetical protein